MLHRVKKQKDINKGKWIGLGGHLENGESPEDCIIREVREECGLELTSFRMRGVITFLSEGHTGEYMFLYTADGFTGELTECSEGELAWIPKNEVYSKELWQGDRLFLDLLRTQEDFFSLKLSYQGDRLAAAVLDGRPLELFDLLDEDGKPTGAVKERSLVHQEGDLHKTAHVWLARKSPSGYEVLLQKRSRNKDAYPGCYDISSAGHVPAGEDYLEAAVREAGEELGLCIKPEELVRIGTHRGRIEAEFYGKPFRNDELAAVYIYTGKADEKKFRLQESEVESVDWVDYQECLKKIQSGDAGYCIWEDEFLMLGEYLRTKNIMK